MTISFDYELQDDIEKNFGSFFEGLLKNSLFTSLLSNTLDKTTYGHLPLCFNLMVVGEKEMTYYNDTYRHKKGATNVLSFPIIEKKDLTFIKKIKNISEYQLHHMFIIENNTLFLGDIILCFSVAVQEVQLMIVNFLFTENNDYPEKEKFFKVFEQFLLTGKLPNVPGCSSIESLIGSMISFHFYHLLVHGVLHLLHYNHEKAKEAQEMEAIEIPTLQGQNFPNPYDIDDLREYMMSFKAETRNIVGL